MLSTLHRLSTQRAACKQWSVCLSVIIPLIGALGRLNGTSLLWVGAPLLLLGLTEAGYAAQERRGQEYLRNRKSGSDDLPLPSEGAAASATRWAVSAMSLSIWPFYIALFAVIAVGGSSFSAVSKNGVGRIVQTSMVQQPSCSVNASSGCGSAAGCGVGGCGASSGKDCSCSGGKSPSTAATRMQPQTMPAQQYIQTANGPVPLQYMQQQQRGPNTINQPVRQPQTLQPQILQPGARYIPPNAAATQQPGGVPSQLAPTQLAPPQQSGPGAALTPYSPTGPSAPALQIPPPASAPDSAPPPTSPSNTAPAQTAPSPSSTKGAAPKAAQPSVKKP